MGSRRKFSETSQLNLLPDTGCDGGPDKEPPCSPDRFLLGHPEKIFIGDTPLKKYLSNAGKGWVIRFRDLLFKQDVRAFLDAYSDIGRKPYHPLVMVGLILYGMQQGRWSLRRGGRGERIKCDHRESNIQ